MASFSILRLCGLILLSIHFTRSQLSGTNYFEYFFLSNWFWGFYFVNLLRQHSKGARPRGCSKGFISGVIAHQSRRFHVIFTRKDRNLLSLEKYCVKSIHKLAHSVEKSSKMLSRILRKNENFFRQINTK